jgi:hypothetical protein
MSVRDRVIDKCHRWGDSGKGVVWDSDAALTNLLLFETFVVDSLHLGIEVPGAVTAFGYDGLLSLLGTNALRFKVGTLSAANLTPGGPEDTFGLIEEGNWTPGLYRVANLNLVSDDVAIAVLPESLEHVPRLTKRQISRLVDAVGAAVVPSPTNFGGVSTLQTYGDILYDSSALRRAVAAWLTRNGCAAIPNDVELSVSIEPGPSGDILFDSQLHIESSLDRRLGLSAKEAHMAIGEGLLALCRLNGRIETMQMCKGIVGVREDESEFIDAKLDFIPREFLPEAQIDRFHRVLTIFNLPQLGPAVEEGSLSIEDFVRLRDSDEGKQFRAWLRDLDDATEAEIEERVDRLRAKAGGALHSNVGRAARFIVVNGISFIPIAGPFVGMALSGLDSFVVDELLPESGPAVFLSSGYPSLFDSRPKVI